MNGRNAEKPYFFVFFVVERFMFATHRQQENKIQNINKDNTTQKPLCYAAQRLIYERFINYAKG